MKTLEQELSDGQTAQRIYDDIKSRIDLIKANLHAKWEDSNADDVEGRESAWQMLKALRELERSYLNDIVTGKMASTQLEKEYNGTNRSRAN